MENLTQALMTYEITMQGNYQLYLIKMQRYVT